MIIACFLLIACGWVAGVATVKLGELLAERFMEEVRRKLDNSETDARAFAAAERRVQLDRATARIQEVEQTRRNAERGTRNGAVL